MVCTEEIVLKQSQKTINRHGWQLSDESDEEGEGVLPPDDLDFGDDDEEDADFGKEDGDFDEE